MDLPKGSNPVNFIRKAYNEDKIEKLISEETVDLFFIPFLSIWTGIPKRVRTIAVIHDVQPFKINTGLKMQYISIYMDIFWMAYIKL